MFDENNKNNEFNEIETAFLKEEISNCCDIDDFKELVLSKLHTQQNQWCQKINEIFAGTGYSKTQFAHLCGVSRVALDGWLSGVIPKSREAFLIIGLVAGYSVEKMNQLLQRYGHYPALYSKCLEDCVCMYVINQNYGEEAITKYRYILERIRASLEGRKAAENTENEAEVENAKDTDVQNENQPAYVVTERLDESISSLESEDELEKFISDNITVFSGAYAKLYAYIKMFIAANGLETTNAESVYEIALLQNWSSSLKQCVSAIRQNKWYPTRRKIISLGLHLSMDHEQVDEMFRLAHMEPLCAKNIFESIIMFILDDALLNNMLDIKAEYFDANDLASYARSVLVELDLPEIADFITELPEEYDDI